jgi:hypothetical protein
MKRRLCQALCVCAALAVCGCASRRAVIELDARHPAIRQTAHGTMIGDTVVRPEEVPEYLSDFDVPHDRTIHILLDSDVRDLRPARILMSHIAKAGYTRPVLVTKRHAEATIVNKRKKPKPAPQPQPRKIRYLRNGK